jgi:hypothetical protein
LALYPYSKKTIISTQSKGKILRLIADINFFDLDFMASTLLPYIEVPSFGISLDSIEKLEKNSIYLLNEIALQSVRNGDLVTAKLILKEITKKTYFFLGGGVLDKQKILVPFIYFFRNLTSESIRRGTDDVLIEILWMVQMINMFCAEEKLEWQILDDLNEFLEDLLLRSLKNDLTRVVKFGFYSLADILFNHLGLIGPNQENETKDDELKENEPQAEWQQISDDCAWILGNVIRKAIELNNMQVAFNGIKEFLKIAHQISESKFSVSNKEWAIKSFYSEFKHFLLKCTESESFKEAIENQGFMLSLTILQILDKNEKYSKLPLIYYSETLIELTEKCQVDSFLLNQLGSIARGFIPNIGDPKIHEEAIIYICRVFNKMREIIERKKNKECKDLYSELFKQLDYLKESTKDKKIKNAKIQEEISMTLSQFDHSKLRNNRELQEDLIVEWPT